MNMTAYQLFIAAGGNDLNWDQQREALNAAFRAERRASFIDAYFAGEELSGNGIVNHFRVEGIAIPASMQKIMQHDDTLISLNSVTARGVSRAVARKICIFVKSSFLAVGGAI